MRIHVHPENPQPRLIRQIAECLRDGGVIIYPTDTLYGLGCDLFQRKAAERIDRIKSVDGHTVPLSLICRDLSHLSDYTQSIDTPLYRMLKRHLPGPYTFILPASREVPKIFQSKKKTIGLRVPDNNICSALLLELEHPLLSSSLPGQTPEDIADPDRIYELFADRVDLIVDGGQGGIIPSTVVDCTRSDWEIIRPGLGEWNG
jgi:tRNA threonylcarbamoyl adenosine modification protein (Sua5/YciO/YrdC/YwlC family)